MKVSLERQTESERGISKIFHAKNQMKITVAELFKRTLRRTNIKPSPFERLWSLSTNYSEHSKDETAEIHYVTMATPSSPLKAGFILLNYV